LHHQQQSKCRKPGSLTCTGADPQQASSDIGECSDLLPENGGVCKGTRCNVKSGSHDCVDDALGFVVSRSPSLGSKASNAAPANDDVQSSSRRVAVGAGLCGKERNAEDFHSAVTVGGELNSMPRASTNPIVPQGLAVLENDQGSSMLTKQDAGTVEELLTQLQQV
jgi:hypothetical protein